MRTLLTLAMVCIPAALAAAPDITKDLKDDRQRELERLKGTWKLTAVEIPGLGDDVQPGNENLELVFSDKDIKPYRNGQLQEQDTTTFTIDPAQKPKLITLNQLQGRGRGPEKIEGIYELKENQLVICFLINPSDETKSKRPASFDEKPEDGFTLVKMTLERKKQ